MSNIQRRMRSRPARLPWLSATILVWAAQLTSAQAQQGEALFKEQCAGCHNGAAQSRAPAPEALRQRSANAILEILSNGAMRVQGSRLNGIQRHQIAEYLAGEKIPGDPTGAATGRCRQNPTVNLTAQHWNGWGAGERNQRFQSTAQAGLSAAQLPRLRLKWAFGFPDAASAWATPTVVGEHLFVGSQNGTVYSLDAATGCIHWFFSADGGVRTAISIGALPSGDSAVYFGDTSANAYALNAQTGKLLWKVKVETHPLARVTGSPVLHGGRLYVPMSSYEESQIRQPDYPCCTFRGSVTALDASTGKLVWRSYVIEQEPRARGKKANGTVLYGPSGAAIWSAPTVDVARGLLYVATGNGYSGPFNSAGDAVIAIEMASGKIAWKRQLHEKDVYVGTCWTELDEAIRPECQEKPGPDYDIGNAPILAKLPGGKDRIVVGQKSGIAWALDPDQRGAVVWQYRVGKGGSLGGMEWGSAVDDTHAYFPLSDINTPQPGGLHAVNLQTGKLLWRAPAVQPNCPSGERRCNAAQGAAITVIPGAVFSGVNDGTMRAYSTKDGTVLWKIDTNGEFQTVNAVPAKGASILCPGPTIVGGMVYVSSGYGAFGGRPGNVLLAYGLPATAAK